MLGAGAITGGARETGILHGLAKAGLGLSTADVIIGSSAGAVLGAQLASGLPGLPQLYELQPAEAGGSGAAGSARSPFCATHGPY